MPLFKYAKAEGLFSISKSLYSYIIYFRDNAKKTDKSHYIGRAEEAINAYLEPRTHGNVETIAISKLKQIDYELNKYEAAVRLSSATTIPTELAEQGYKPGQRADKEYLYNSKNNTIGEI